MARQMNERIRLLAEQAGYTKDMFGVGHWNMPECEKFAQLIVAECIAQCEKNKDHQWLGSGSKMSAFNIREHFGVENQVITKEMLNQTIAWCEQQLAEKKNDSC